ncbi:MAG: helix-turn-helix domain-containing protein [Myxococcota bacterium]
MTHVASLRDRQTVATRDLILDSAVDLLGTDGAFEFSFAAIARKAGVAVRTIYRHFPTRDALFGAMSQRVNDRVGLAELPEGADAMAALPEALFAAFDRNEALVLAQMQTQAGREVRTRARSRRIAKIKEVVEQEAPACTPEARRRMAGVVTCLLSANIWHRMKTELGMDGAESGAAVAWALRVIIDAVRRENRRAETAKRGSDQ